VSDPIDIKALDEYLKGGSEVSQRYRELGGDDVPPDLDRRVLAAARDAVAQAGAQRSRSWLRWSTPVALAASVVLVVTVLLEKGVQDELVLPAQSPAESRPVSSDAATEGDAASEGDAAAADDAEAKLADEVVPQLAPAEAPRVPTPAQPAVPEAEAERYVASPPEITVEAQALRARREQQQATPVTSVQSEPSVAPPPEPAPEAQVSARKSLERSETESAASSSDLAEVVITGASRARRPAGRGVGPRGTISSSVFKDGDSQALAGEQRERADPQAWLEDIRELRRAGKSDEADREWQLFREAFPDVQVADDDIARKKP
jgi:hypothetical protein